MVENEPSAAGAPFGILSGVGKSFGSTPALREIDLEIPSGEITVVLGPSGCGKTTLLRILAGLTEPDRGTVRLGGTLVNDPGCRVPVEERGLGMVFQDSLLWPHLSARRNISFSLGRDADADRKVRSAAASARAEKLLDRFPAEMSGGERRRVALARAVVREPRLLLMDEPLSGLDANLRVRLLLTIREIQRSLDVPVVYVTHDQEEALGLADRVVVMREGRILQSGTPVEVYRNPKTAFVAGFVGLSTLLSGSAASGRVRTALGDFDWEAGEQGPVLLAVRPESVVEREEGVEARVTASSFLGDRWLTELVVADQELLSYTPMRKAPGEKLRIGLDPAPVPVDADEETE